MRWLILICSISSCNGERPCGAALDAGTRGATVTVGTSFVYGDYTSSQNNDCTPLASQVVSVTVQGTQVEPAPGGPTGMVLCLPRPDQIDDDPIPLSDTTRVQLIDIFASDGPCGLRLDHSAVPTGTITFKGFCTNAGVTYGITLSGSVGGVRSCPSDAGPPVETPVTLELGGAVAVGTL